MHEHSTTMDFQPWHFTPYQLKIWKFPHPHPVFFTQNVATSEIIICKVPTKSNTINILCNNRYLNVINFLFIYQTLFTFRPSLYTDDKVSEGIMSSFNFASIHIMVISRKIFCPMYLIDVNYVQVSTVIVDNILPPGSSTYMVVRWCN